jgi:hypothetical protein
VGPDRLGIAIHADDDFGRDALQVVHEMLHERATKAGAAEGAPPKGGPDQALALIQGHCSWLQCPSRPGFDPGFRSAKSEHAQG